jgi:hypothetical protein
MTQFQEIPGLTQVHVEELNGPALDGSNPAIPIWRDGRNEVVMRPGSQPGTVALIGKRDGAVFRATSAGMDQHRRLAEVVMEMLRASGR